MKLNWSIILSLCTTLLNASPNRARMLHIFSGTLTEITCSAVVPVFQLMRQGMQYGSQNYNELPELFDIEARTSSNETSVTLFVNGTYHSDNLTIMCRNFNNVVVGTFETLFTVVLEFVSILPPPSGVQYTISEQEIRMTWDPPILLNDELSSQNVSTESRIEHYVLHTTTEESTVINYTVPGTSFSIKRNNLSCSLSFQVTAVNPAGIGESSPSQMVDWCVDIFNTAEPSFSGEHLSAGEIAAIAIGCVVAITMMIIGSTVVLFIISDFIFKKHGGRNAVIPDQPQSDLVDTHQSGKIEQSSTTQKKNPQGLMYADLDLVGKSQVPRPDSFDPIGYSSMQEINITQDKVTTSTEENNND